MHLAAAPIRSTTHVLDGVGDQRATTCLLSGHRNQPADASCRMQFSTSYGEHHCKATASQQVPHHGQALQLEGGEHFNLPQGLRVFYIGLAYPCNLRHDQSCTEGYHFALVQSFLASFMLNHTVRLTSVAGAAWQALPASNSLRSCRNQFCIVSNHCGSWECCRHAKGAACPTWTMQDQPM